MQRPAPWQILFAFKAFAAAMLALYIAFAMDLPRPYWALTTVFVVSQPFAGAVRSKGVFRLAGTIVGAVGGVALYGVFGDSQAWMIAGLVGWLCVCGYFALSDRSPRSYFFLLAGLTALLVAWPGSSLSAGPAFETALSRVEEIALGILCAVFVDSIFFPRRIAPVVDSQIATWFDDARDWSLDVLAGNREKAAHDRGKLAADAAQIGTMAVHLEYEMHENRTRAYWVRILQQRMLLLLPVLSSIDDRLGELRRDESRLSPETAALIARLEDWLKADCPPEAVSGLMQAINAFDPSEQGSSQWTRILLVSLIGRIREFIEIRADCAQLWNQARKSPSMTPSDHLKDLAARTVTHAHTDRGLVVWALSASLLSFAVSASFWYFTGWSGGSTMTLISLLMSLFFGAMDNPLPMLKMMLKVLCFAVVFDTLYLFVIAPRIDSFPTLVLAFAPALIPLGILASNPATFMVALLPIAFMSLQSTAYSAFPAFVNGLLAMLCGVTVVLAVTSLVKTISAEVSARRILRAGWHDLERIAALPSGPPPAAFASRMLDRLGLLVPRLATLDPDHSLTAVDALSELRLGLNLVELQRRRRDLKGSVRARVDGVLEAVRLHFRQRRSKADIGDPDFLQHIDDALAEAIAIGEDETRRTVILTLAGVRRALFPDAAPYRASGEESPDRTELRPLAVAAE